jgi:hypothetical protein
MPVVLFQQTTDKYGDTEIDASEQLRSVSFAVSAPYSALYQVAKAVQGGKPVWDLSEIPAQPGQGGFADKIFGIRFKSFDPAHPTTILCKAFYEDDPVPTGDLSSTAVFNTGGSVTPGGASVQVNKNGVLVGTEPILNFIDPLGVGLTLADNLGPPARIDITPNYPVKFLDFINPVAQATLDTNVILGGDIPQIFSYLEFLIMAESTLAGLTDSIRIQVNGDVGANYNYTGVRGSNAVASAYDSFGNVNIFASNIPGATLNNWMAQTKVTIPWYRGAKIKNLQIVGGFSGNNAPIDAVDVINAEWLSAAAIRRLNFFTSSGSNFAANACRLIGYGYP